MDRFAAGGMLVIVGFLLGGCLRPAASSTTLPVSRRDTLAYSLALIQNPFPMIRVVLLFEGSKEGKTTLDMGASWGGVDHPEDHIHGLTVCDPQGQHLEVMHERGHSWMVRHLPGQPLKASYYLIGTTQDPTEQPQTIVKPIIRKDLVHLIGPTFLIYPLHLAGRDAYDIALSWKGFTELGWKVVSSFGTRTMERVRTTIDSFRESVFLASPGLRLSSYGAVPGGLLLATYGQWEFPDAVLGEHAAAILRSERQQFPEKAPHTFLLTAIPFGEPGSKTKVLSGTGLTDSFVLFLPANIKMDGTQGISVTWLLGHEFFHRWNGQLLKQAPPEELGYWFSEGFTNFYMRRLLYRSGLVTLDEYVKELNSDAKNYFLSPVRDQSNARIQRDYWTSNDLSMLPYTRGDMIAILVDNEISRRSEHKKNLDDLMRELLAGVPQREFVTPELILKTIERYTSTEFAQRIQKVVLDGALVKIDLQLLAPCLKGKLKRNQASLPFPEFSIDHADRCPGIL